MANDDESPPGARDEARVPDAHGQAAILLVESLIHGLIAKKVIATSDAVEIVDIAHEVEGELGGDIDDTPDSVRKSHALLSAIRDSLSADLNNG